MAQYMLVGNPNSGTDWIAPILARHVRGGPERYWQKEFFNPVTNPKYRELLMPVFPSEAFSTVKNYGIRLTPQLMEEVLEPIYQDSWMREDFTFNKEVCTPDFLEWYQRHFVLVGLIRETRTLFPPTKARTWSMYEAMWHGMVQNGWPLRRSSTMESRAMEAHEVARLHLMREMQRLNVPYLRYEVLTKGAPEDVYSEFSRVDWLDADSITEEVVSTRRDTKAELLSSISAFAADCK